MEIQDRQEIVENVRYLLDVDDDLKLKMFLVDVHPADLADIMRELEDEERVKIFKLLDHETASEVLLEFDDYTRENLILDLDTAHLSKIVNQMDSDDATDVVASLPEEIAKTVLTSINRQDRSEVEQLLKHEEDTAGGIMALEFVAVYEDQTIDDAIQQLRKKSKEVEDVYFVYAVDRNGKLVGMVPLKQLIMNNPDKLIKDVMDTDVISVTVERDQEEVANLVRRYDLVSVPVVDTSNRLVGRITIDDIVDVLQEEANEDIQRMAGISDEELLQETSTLRISRNRLPWLFIAFMGELASAYIMSRFGASLRQIVALTFFVPIIMAMGGSSGQQASIIVVSSIAMGEGSVSNYRHRLFRELRVGLLIGIIFSVLIFLIIQLWFGDFYLGLIVGSALLVVIINALFVGSTIPVILQKLNFDPVLATGPFISTANDVLGLLVYFTLATLYLHWMH